MTRWTIEKSGTGIEKSGTGIEKSGTGIEKSGTGIEKSGTGIEKSGTGIRKAFIALSLAALAFTTQVNAAGVRPEGYMQIAVDQGQVSVMWNIDGSTFVGKGTQNGTYTQVSLFELSLFGNAPSVEIAGGGTGIDIAGGGTGIDIAGGGTGSKIEIAGGGTGIEIAGGGTGIEIAGGGTGIEIAGGGTGIEIAGGGTGIEIAGGGTGYEGVYITLPNGTGLELEIEMGCNSARVSVLDSSDFSEVVSFDNIQVLGDTGLCQVASNDSRLVSARKPNKRSTS